MFHDLSCLGYYVNIQLIMILIIQKIKQKTGSGLFHSYNGLNIKPLGFDKRI